MAARASAQERKLADQKKSIRDLFPQEQPVERIWILVVGLKHSGKSKFISNFSSVFHKTGYKQSLDEEDHNLAKKDMEDLLDGREPDDRGAISKRKKYPRPSFVVLVMKERQKDSDDDPRGELELLKAIRGIIAAKDVPSCLVIARDQLTKSNDVNNLECLDMHKNRVFLVALEQANPTAESLFLTALEAIAKDTRQRFRDEQQADTRKPSQREPLRHLSTPHPQTRRRRQTSGNTLVQSSQKRQSSAPFDISSWKSIGKKQGCPGCNWMDTCTDAHVLCMTFETNLDARTGQKGEFQRRSIKLSEEQRVQFVGAVNAILNSEESCGTISLHLDGRLNNVFMDQIRKKLTDLISDDSLYDDNYEKSHSPDGNHIAFRVKPRDRPLSTMDLKIKLASDTGLEAPSQGNIQKLMSKVSTAEEDRMPLHDEPDPKFRKDAALPSWCTECTNVQMKAVPEKDIHRSSGSNKAERFSNFVLENLNIVSYVCAFVLNSNKSCIYLGVREKRAGAKTGANQDGDGLVEPSQERRPERRSAQQETGPCKPDEGFRTGGYVCDGVTLNKQERSYFQSRLRGEVFEKNLKVYPNEPIPDDLVTVKFLPVEADPREEDLCVVKITVKPFHGIIWPDHSGPVAYKMVLADAGGDSRLERMSFEDWKDRIVSAGITRSES
ncbi:hypothetical protein BaRGS_00028363 [Batillaria attramentaria]|uniref:Uncharacterized protein n=1 Tax=Batillaria attramentaria TaxID=370345 RepID=A0ABD0K043_9CAEN